MKSRVWLGLAFVGVLLAGCGLGYLLGRRGREAPTLEHAVNLLTREANATWFDVIVDTVRGHKIRSNLQ